MLFFRKKGKKEARTMLSFASDFWPLFWTIIGSGALLTMLICVGIATCEPTWYQRSHSATVHHLPRRHGSAAHPRKAA
jgi:hypothetical protein